MTYNTAPISFQLEYILQKWPRKRISPNTFIDIFRIEQIYNTKAFGQYNSDKAKEQVQSQMEQWQHQERINTTNHKHQN